MRGGQWPEALSIRCYPQIAMRITLSPIAGTHGELLLSEVGKTSIIPHRGFRARLPADISANVYANADRDRYIMTAARIVRRKAHPHPCWSSASAGLPRLLALRPFFKVTTEQGS